MRVLLLADRSFAVREHTMLRRLEIGLIDEGVRVARALPGGCPGEPTTGLAAAIAYNDARWRLGSPAPATTILRDLDAAETLTRTDPEEAPIDLIHAWGDGAWSLALELAADTGADLLLEVWSGAALARTRAIERAHGTSLESAGSRALWLAPDRAMLAALEASSPRWGVRCSSWGVHAPPEPRPAPEPGRPVGACVCFSGRDEAGCLAMLNGLARVASVHQDLLVFLDESGVSARPGIWKHAEKLDLLESLSVIEGMESRRQLVLCADILVLPEALGEHRSLLLEAMAAGMLVIARVDPMVEPLHAPGAPVILVEQPSTEAWERAFGGALADPLAGHTLAQSGRRTITDGRLAHQHVRATLDAYQSLDSERPIALNQGRPPRPPRPPA